MAFNGEATIQYFLENTADLMILDEMMPIKNGIKVCKEIMIRSLDLAKLLKECIKD